MDVTRPASTPGPAPLQQRASCGHQRARQPKSHRSGRGAIEQPESDATARGELPCATERIMNPRPAHEAASSRQSDVPATRGAISLSTVVFSSIAMALEGRVL